MTTAIKRKTSGRKLRTYFHGKELRDATTPLAIPVLPSDLAKAESVRSEDVNAITRFQECLVAQACNRVFGDDAKVAIMRTSAWVFLPGEKFAYRYTLGAAARALVAGFDKKEPIEIGTMVQFDVPTPGNSLSHHRAKKQAWSKANRLFQSGGTRPRKTSRKQQVPDPLHGVIRNGVYVRL